MISSIPSPSMSPAATRMPPMKLVSYGVNCDSTSPVVCVHDLHDLRGAGALARSDDDHRVIINGHDIAIRIKLKAAAEARARCWATGRRC